MLVRITDDYTYSRELRQFLWGTLRITTGDKDLSLGILPVDATDAGADILVGRSGDRAGVENNDRSVMRDGGAVEAAVKQFALDGGAVGLGGAAAEVFNEEAGHGAIIPAEKGRISACACGLFATQQPKSASHLFPRERSGDPFPLE